MEPTYEYYAANGGKLGQEAFNAHLGAAVKAVESFVWPNETDGSDAYLRAVCAAVDVDSTYGGSIGGGVSGFTIGSLSISKSDQAGDYGRDMRNAIERELDSTDMLYMGVG
jgi:hypothetical protein